MNSFSKRIFLLIFTFMVSINYGLSQCAMCKATIENNGEIGETDYGNGINKGIIFLMIFPYLILLFFFRKRIFKKIKEIRGSKG